MKTKEVWTLEAKISDLKKKFENKRSKLDQNKKRESNKREGNKAKNSEDRNPKRTKPQSPAWMFQKPKENRSW